MQNSSILRLLATGVCALLAGGAAAEPVINTNFFPYSHGWLGADAAYSIRLNKSETLWLFGDTFVGERREPRTMIHNSVAIRNCQAGICRLGYWWSGRYTGHAISFFKTPESDYYWPLDGFVYRQKLYIFLERMHTTGGGGAFGFDYSRIMLATVLNFAAKPDQWRISYQTVATGNAAIPGVAVVRPDQSTADYLYVFTLFRRSAPKPFAGLLRLRLDDLAVAGTAAQWQYLAGESKWRDWKRSTSPADASKVLAGNITEMSVVFHAERQEWMAVYPTPGALSNTACYSTARNLGGPWAGPRPLFHYPEMRKDDPRYSAHVFCYAAKEHPELERENEIAFTYACNSTEEPEVLRDMRLYRPELVKKKLAVR